MSKPRQPGFVYYAHHKCASSWINRFLWKVTAAMGIRFDSFHSDEQAGGDIAAECRRRGLEAVSIRNARWDHVPGFAGCRGLHVIRDPRDVLVSGYFSHLKTHRVLSDELTAERERLQGLGKEAGLIESMSGINGRTLREMGEWRYGEAEGVLELRLEEMSGRAEESLCRILEHAGWLEAAGSRGADPLGAGFLALVNEAWRRSGGKSLLHRRCRHIPAGSLRRILGEVSFEKLSGGRKPGQTDTSSHYRTGVHGDWAKHFTPAVEGEFKRQFPGLVARLGYEADEHWTGQPGEGL